MSYNALYSELLKDNLKVTYFIRFLKDDKLFTTRAITGHAFRPLLDGIPDIAPSFVEPIEGRSSLPTCKFKLLDQEGIVSQLLAGHIIKEDELCQVGVMINTTSFGYDPQIYSSPPTSSADLLYFGDGNVQVMFTGIVSKIAQEGNTTSIELVSIRSDNRSRMFPLAGQKISDTFPFEVAEDTSDKEWRIKVDGQLVYTMIANPMNFLALEYLAGGDTNGADDDSKKFNPNCYQVNRQYLRAGVTGDDSFTLADRSFTDAGTLAKPKILIEEYNPTTGVWKIHKIRVLTISAINGTVMGNTDDAFIAGNWIFATYRHFNRIDFFRSFDYIWNSTISTNATKRFRQKAVTGFELPVEFQFVPSGFNTDLAGYPAVYNTIANPIYDAYPVATVVIHGKRFVESRTFADGEWSDWQDENLLEHDDLAISTSAYYRKFQPREGIFNMFGYELTLTPEQNWKWVKNTARVVAGDKVFPRLLWESGDQYPNRDMFPEDTLWTGNEKDTIDPAFDAVDDLYITSGTWNSYYVLGAYKATPITFHEIGVLGLSKYLINSTEIAQVRDDYFPEASYNMRLFWQDQVDEGNVKEWIEENIFKPIGGFPVVTSLQSGSDYIAGAVKPVIFNPPLLTEELRTFDENSIVSPLVITRDQDLFINDLTINTDYHILKGEYFTPIKIEMKESKLMYTNRHNLTIDSPFMVKWLGNGDLRATERGQEIINRFGFGADTIEMETNMSGVPVELGDLINLQYGPIWDGRTGKQGINCIAEVLEKKVDYAKGIVKFKLLRTYYHGRYSQISPSSLRESGLGSYTSNSVTKIKVQINREDFQIWVDVWKHLEAGETLYCYLRSSDLASSFTPVKLQIYSLDALNSQLELDYVAELFGDLNKPLYVIEFPDYEDATEYQKNYCYISDDNGGSLEVEDAHDGVNFADGKEPNLLI